MNKFAKYLCLFAAFAIALPSYAAGTGTFAPHSNAAAPSAVQISQGGAVLSSTNPIFVVPGSVAQASITNTTASVPNTSTTVTLAAASRHVIVKTDPAAAILYVDFADGTATSADFRVEPGGAVTIEGPSITTFKILGASATGTYSVLAW
jgi:hypothetical protein